MADSQQGAGSTSSPDLHGTRDDLAQASLALNTAYDRLQDLRTSLRNFTAHRERARQGSRIRAAGTMGPDHSAILFSDSDEESEIDMDLLRETLPAQLLELTSSLDSNRRARLSLGRQLASSEPRNDNSSSLAMSTSEEPRPIYPPLRRRRALPPATSSRSGGITPPGSTSPARRSILEAHLRQLRHASNPGESTTTLGRRVAQRAAAAAQGSTTGLQDSSTTGTEPLDSILHATFPMDAESRPSTSGLESRAASHLRYSLLPNPPSGIRTSSGSRISPTVGAHPRFSERVEHRPRTARSNSLTALTRGTPTSTSQANQQPGPSDASTQTPASSRSNQLRATVVPMWGTDTTARPEGTSELGSREYRVRRRLNAQGEEHVFNIDLSELLSDGDREDGLSDQSPWMRSPLLPRASRVRPGRAQTLQEPETDDTVQGYVPFYTREGREGSVQRRRGWARLNADGDEISTEDEANLENSRAETRMPRTRNWSLSGQWTGSISVLDFVHRNSRDATTGHRDIESLEGDGSDTHQPDDNLRRVINSMFCPVDATAAYTSPLPVPFPEKTIHGQPQEFSREVQVTLDGRIAGR